MYESIQICNIWTCSTLSKCIITFYIFDQIWAISWYEIYPIRFQSFATQNIIITVVFCFIILFFFYNLITILLWLLLVENMIWSRWTWNLGIRDLNTTRCHLDFSAKILSVCNVEKIRFFAIAKKEGTSFSHFMLWRVILRV